MTTCSSQFSLVDQSDFKSPSEDKIKIDNDYLTQHNPIQGRIQSVSNSDTNNLWSIWPIFTYIVYFQ